MKYGFVVLHYLAYDMTLLCIEQLLKNFQTDDIHIVVVDNASSNGSGLELKRHFKNTKKIDVLLNKTNLGFARGNNVGYEYLVKNYSPDFIVVMNNDVLIRDKDFLNSLSKIYLTKGFAVLGPDIFNPLQKKHQNPGMLHMQSLKEVLERNKKMKQDLSHFDLYYLKLFFSEAVRGNVLLKKIYRFAKYKILKRPKLDYTKTYENPHLHGSCYIFSKDFISARQYAFNPATFLYFEEDVLMFECLSSNLKMLYDPIVYVEHLEDVSTNLAYSSRKKKERFKLSEMIKSSDVLIELMKQANGDMA